MRRSFFRHRPVFSALMCAMAWALASTPTRAQQVQTPPPATAATTPVTSAPAPAPVPPASSTPAPAPSAPASKWEHSRGPQDFAATFFVGGGFFDFSNLNDRLAANGYERLEGPVWVIGGEGRSVSPSGFVFGGHGAAIFGASGNGPGALETEWSAGYGMVDFGYAPVRSQTFLFALSAGIGGYGTTLEIADNRGSSFENVLEAPRRGTELTRGGIEFGLTLRTEARIPLAHIRDDQQAYFTVGLRVTGLWGPAIDDWSLPDGDDADGGPTTGLTGVYAALLIGWGGLVTVPEAIPAPP